jgi:hypothetical protein
MFKSIPTDEPIGAGDIVIIGDRRGAVKPDRSPGARRLDRPRGRSSRERADAARFRL